MKKTCCRSYTLCLVFLLLISCIFAFIGCQSTNKKEAYLSTSEFDNVRYEYDEDLEEMTIIWSTTLTNNTIYNIKQFSVKFKLFNNNTYLGTHTYYWDKLIKHGGKYTGRFNFKEDFQITHVEYLSWNVEYYSFWNTYKIWFIVTIILVCFALLIYIVAVLVQDLDLEDVFDSFVDFFEEYAWFAVFLIIPFGGLIWGIVTSYWVPILIVLGGFVAFIVLALLFHLVRLIVTSIADCIVFGGYGNSNNNYDYDNQYLDDIADYLDDKGSLMQFSVWQLKDYCRENGIRGYSSLNKSEIVDLISTEEDENKSKKTNKSKKEVAQKKISNITFNDIAGLEEAKAVFREKVVYAFQYKDIYEKYGKKVGGGLLLYGLPGTGKTMFAEAASNETDSLFIPIKCSDIKSKWYGESENNVKKIFDKARKAKKAIIFFDEFEAIGAKRTDSGDNGNNDLVPQILAEMQGVGTYNDDSVIMVIAATNKPWSIDSAFLRPGRFDEKIYIPLPDFKARKKMFELKLKTIPQDGLEYEYLAQVTDGFNGADIGAFCDKLKMRAINKSITNKNDCPIVMQDVLEVSKTIKSSVSPEDMERLAEFESQYS